MTALTDRLTYPNPKRVFLAEPTAGERLTFWTLESGKTYTYFATIAAAGGKVVGCREDGAALSDQTSIANVEANAGSWYAAAGKIYVHPAGSDSPYDHTLQAVLRFHFSDRPRVYNSIYYDPRISEIPDMSLRVEPEFGAVGQIGGGSLSLRNEDGFFDTLSLQWDAGTLPIKMAIDPPGSEATYGEFDVIGTWRVRRWETRDDKFVMQFDEVKAHVKKKIPIEFYSRDDYPLMDEQDLGKPIQIAYGMVLDVRPVCIDLTTKRFKVAGHAIWKFYAARIKNEATEAWGDTPMSDLDEANGELTIAAWDLHQGVAVDFAGKPNPDGTLMENPADIVRDLLKTYLGVTDAEIDDVA